MSTIIGILMLLSIHQDGSRTSDELRRYSAPASCVTAVLLMRAMRQDPTRDFFCVTREAGE
jgi:hypothetical protein